MPAQPGFVPLIIEATGLGEMLVMCRYAFSGTNRHPQQETQNSENRQHLRSTVECV